MTLAAKEEEEDELMTRLRSNDDPNLQHLFLSSEALSRRTVEALTRLLAAPSPSPSSSTSSSLSETTIVRHLYFRNFVHVHSRNDNGNGALETLLKALAVGCMAHNHLEGLYFHCTQVPVAMLTQVLLNAPQLESLGLRYCKLIVSTTSTNDNNNNNNNNEAHPAEAEWRALEYALREHSGLQEVCLESCEVVVVTADGRPAETDIDAGRMMTRRMDSLLQAVAAIPSLTRVEYVPTAYPSSSSNTRTTRLLQNSLQAIGSAPQLKSLKMRNCALEQEDVVVLCRALEQQHQQQHDEGHRMDNKHSNTDCSSSKLESLMISCHLGNTSAAALSHLLWATQDSLQQFTLRVDQLDRHEADCPQLLAHAMMGEDHPSRIKQFQLAGSAAGNMSDAAKASFSRMVQTNVHLDTVQMDIFDVELQGQISFYLHLNHRGRRDLFHNHNNNVNNNNNTSSSPAKKRQKMPADEEHSWVNALCQNTCDVRALHYFLALHPALFATAALTAISSHNNNNNNHLMTEVR